MRLDASKISVLAAMIATVLGSAGLSQEANASTADKTTLSTTITGASQGYNGYHKLVAQPNSEGRVVRMLDGPVPQNLTDSVPLLAFGHMSDTQICDDQATARVPFMDKRNDIDSSWDTASAYRPQERLLPQMATAMVSSLRNLGAGPKTNLPLAFTLITGDMVDNQQFNETRNYINLMDGGLVRPNNWVDPSVEEGPGYGGNDTFHKYSIFPWSLWGGVPSAYYHPDGSVPYSGSPPDWYRQHGFPVIANLLSASRRNFVSPGLGMPWYAVFGNHDMSIQGNLPRGSTLGGWANNHATASTRIYDANIPWNYPSGAADWADAIGNIIYDHDVLYDTPATADPNRLLLNKAQFMEEHYNSTGLPVGHGLFNSTGKSYYVIPSAGPNDRFKFIALDTTNNNGFGAGGWIDLEQWDWLIGELKAASTRYWEDGTGWVTNSSAKDKLIVLYGHHTLLSMNKITKIPTTGMPLGHTGIELEQLLLRFPNVVMLVDGHTHKNSITGHWMNHPGPEKWKLNGFWEVTSPAAADFPVQSRVIEVGLSSTGTAWGVPENNYLSIYTTMLDIDAPVTFDPNGYMSDYRELASVGRELSYNDPGDRTGSQQLGWRAGYPEDRNTQLIVPTPFPMNDFQGPPSANRAVHIVTQRADTKDAKILRMKSDANFSGEVVDFSSNSLQGSDIVGTGNFTQGLKGPNFGNDLVLRDSNGNIRIKLLDNRLVEVSYPGYGAAIRGSVDSGTELSGIGDLDGDGRDDIVWRHSNGTVEAWFEGSIANRKYLNLAKNYSSPTPDPGSEQWKIAAVGDFNADGYADLLRETISDHSQFIRYMHGADWTADVSSCAGIYFCNNKYSAGWDFQPGVGHSVVGTAGDHLLYRKMRSLEYPSSNYTVALYDPDGGLGNWQSVFYQNVWGWNAPPEWHTIGLGDFDLNDVHDILWRHDNGYFAIWRLRGNTTSAWLGETGFTALGPEWVVKGLLQNTDYVIY